MNTAITPRTPEATVPATVPQTRWLRPAVDVLEGEGTLLLLVDLPGVGRDELKIELDDDQLLVEGRRDEQTGWRRAFHVPRGYDTDAIEARLDAGVLELRLPRTPEAQPRRIEVKG